jgi:hypothetical protein
MMGLATIENRLVLCGPDGTSRKRFDVLLHPALVDTMLGQAAIEADVAFVMRGALRSIAKTRPRLGEVMTWLDTEEEELADWKITDREVSVVQTLGELRVVSRSRSSASMLIEMHGFRDDGPADLFNARMRNAMRDLLRALPAFDTLNDFAEVLALMRWLEASGVALDAPHVGSSMPASTPRAIIPDSHRYQAFHELTSDADYVAPRANSRSACSKACRAFPSA